MNKGDKLLCTKDIFNPINGKQRFYSGKWYEIVKLDQYCSDTIYLYPDDGDGICYLTLDDRRIENFVTLSEWRDLQINLILENG